MSKEANDVVIWYEHHGVNVAVLEQMLGKHWEHCLCSVCKKFDIKTIDTNKHCSVAQASFNICRAFGVTMPMWECPIFVDKRNIYE